MPSAPDDPRLTAYALGELDEADRPEVEALIQSNPEAARFIADVLATARLLTEHLKSETIPTSAPAILRAVEDHLEPKPLPDPAPSRRRWFRYAFAASLLGVAAGWVAVARWTNSRESVSHYALALRPDASRPAAPLPAGPKIEWGETSASPPGPAGIGAKFDQSPPMLSDGVVDSEKRVAEQPAAANNGLGDLTNRENRSFNPRDLGFDSNSASSQRRGLGGAPAATSREKAEDSFRLQSEPLGLAKLVKQGASSGGISGKPAASPEMALKAGRSLASAATSTPTPTLFTKQKAEAVQDLSRFSVASPTSKPAQLGRVALLEAEALDKDEKTLPQLVEARRLQLEDRAKGGDAFARIVDNAFLPVEANPLSTFSIDVDTASYANVRRYLNQATRPPADAVRIEELMNYFAYDYPKPEGPDPFSVNLETARCPWDPGHRLVRIGLKGREVDVNKRPPSNLVFLIDVSGSMMDLDKLPLLKAGMKLLVDQLGENDRVAIVVYAGSEGLALPSTSCSQKERVVSALEQLQAGGSTNGGKGIELAYDVAVQNYIQGGTNRVILATDGDFNVGVTEGADLDRLIQEKKKSKVFLSVLGFGQGNVQHDKLESLADKGDGQYSFIDTIQEARKVLVEEVGGTLVAIAKDVKIQVKFNPRRASSYRLIGYENRALQARDFADDKKDAGEIGAGHCVTAFYEVVPTPSGQGGDAEDRTGPELLTVDLRYKAPDGDVSKLLSFPAIDDGRDFAAASADFKFASGVAGFGMLLRASPHAGSLTWPGLLEMAGGAVGADPGGYRKEFLELVRKAQSLDQR